MASDPRIPLRRLVLAALALVAVLVAALWVALAQGDARHAGASADVPEPAADLIVPNDRTVKADLLDRLEQPPQVLIFGGSRATRFAPAYLEKLTGLRGFNLALQNGRPEDAWAFLNHLRTTRPGIRPHVVWFIHVEAFRKQGLSVGLVQDARLSRYFPDDLIAAEREKLPRTKAQMPAGRDLALTTYGPDGVVLRNRYDIRAEDGYTLDRALAWSIDRATERYATTTPALDPRSTEYFEKSLDLLDRLGRTPVIVFMPIHPALLDAVRPLGWEERHREVLAYLHSLQQKYDFIVLDLSELASVRGDPDAFYDGFHMTASNARRVLDTVVTEAPQAFE
ncbi:MAG TPA: hypothetical protein PK838_05800 [Thermoleophilia bacterium]|nr:hypothetical protein [Thermoleophilia bacterium]